MLPTAAVTSTLATAADLEDPEDLASVALPAAVLLADRSTLPTYVDLFSGFLAYLDLEC